MRRNLVLLLALFLPTFVYWLYIKLEQHRGNMTATQPWWMTAPWPKLAIATTITLAVMLIGMTLLHHTTEGVYEPAHMVDGKLIEGHINSKSGQ